MKFRSNARYNEPAESGTIYEGKIGGLRVSVHRIIHCEGWFLSCPDMGIIQMKLKSDTLIGAIEESKMALKKTVERMANDVNSFCAEEIEVSKY
jgi:hypothetical protein